MKAINIYTKRQIDTSNYVNTITGEVLFSEFPNTTSINVKDANLIIVDYEEFITIDSKALRYILTIFNQPDISKILRMADMVKGIYNVIHDEKGSAHSPQSLRLCLSYDAAEFSTFLKRLHTKSIIHCISGYKDGRKCKWIMLNPPWHEKRKFFTLIVQAFLMIFQRSKLVLRPKKYSDINIIMYGLFHCQGADVAFQTREAAKYLDIYVQDHLMITFEQMYFSFADDVLL